MKIVTSGNRYIDIDAYAGCIAYASMLKMKNIEAKAVSTAKINESVTPSLLKSNFKLEKYEKLQGLLDERTKKILRACLNFNT